MRKPLDILLGTKTPQQSEPTPVEKTRAKIYDQAPLTKVLKKNQEQTKAKSESAYNAELKRKRTAVKNVVVDTKYGKMDVPQVGYESYTLAQKEAWLKATRKEIEADIDKKQKASGGTVPAETVNPYDPGKPVTEGDVYQGMTNEYLGLQPAIRTANAISKTDTGKAISRGAKGVSETIAYKTDDPVAQFMADLTINAPAGFAESVSNIFNADVDNIGKMQSMGEVYATVVPVGQSLKAGKAVFDASRKAGVPLIKALAKGAGAAAMENIGIGSRAVSNVAESVVNPVSRATEAVRNIPAKIRRQLAPDAQFDLAPTRPASQVADVPPTTPTSFADQQRAMIRDVIGADDIDYEDFYGTANNNSKLVRDTDPTVAVPTPEEARAQIAETDPTSLRSAESMAQKLKGTANTTPREPSVPTVTATADAPQNVTGISNAANLSDFEQGILSSAPEGKGRSVKEILETNSARKDWDDIADRVNKGESYTADTAATVLLGKADYTARVKSAKDAIERAIVEGASDDVMRGLRRKLDDEIEAATEFAEKIQRGKSDWSDVGRTFATMLNYDTKQIASVLQEARIRKGAPLTQADIDMLTARVKELTDLLEESNAEIARLIKEHADNATKVAATRRVARTPEARAAKRKQALDEFMAASSGLNAYVNPKVIKQFAKYMYTLIEDGARSVDDIVAAAAKDGVKADQEDVYAAFRSQVKESTLSDLQKEVAKTKRELMAAAKAADPDTVLPGRRQMTTEQKIKFREGALRNEIAKLDKQIEQKKRFPKGAKIESPEIKRLEAIRKEKQATLDEITKPQKEAKAATDRAAAIQSQIDKLNKQAEDGTLPAPKKREIDAQIQALEIERRKALKAAQDASPEYQANLLEKDKERLRAKLKALEERIANKDYAEVSVIKQARRTDAEINKLRQKIRVKDEMVKAGVEDMRPRTAADNVGTYLNEIKLWNVASRAADLTANAVKFADFAKSTGTRRLVDLATSKYLDDIPLTKGTNADRTARIFNNAKERLKADAELIWKGGDGGSVKKYGSAWIGGKAAGLTDVPFKSFYTDWMNDLAADVKARKKLGNNASPEAIATEREAILANLDEHPDIQLMAEEYSLNQTFNNPNWASETTGFWRRKAEKSGKVAPILVDEFLGRFAKVITNVAIDATDRTGVGILRGRAKLKRAKSLGQELTTSERAIINDMITKGFTGIPTALAGYYLGDKVLGTIKGERNKYIDYGDAEKIGGPMSIFLLGATLKKAESIKDPNEALKLQMGTIARLPLNTPLASNAKDVLDLFTEFDAKSASKYAARKVTGLLPWMSQSRDIAERMDAKGAFGLKTGAEVERDKMPKEISTKTGNEIQTSNFFKILEADFMSRTPGLRQRLPIKKTAEDNKKEAATKKKKEVKIEDLLR